jgi:hypothetical protein
MKHGKDRSPAKGAWNLAQLHNSIQPETHNKPAVNDIFQSINFRMEFDVNPYQSQQYKIQHKDLTWTENKLTLIFSILN